MMVPKGNECPYTQTQTSSRDPMLKIAGKNHLAMKFYDIVIEINHVSAHGILGFSDLCDSHGLLRCCQHLLNLAYDK